MTTRTHIFSDETGVRMAKALESMVEMQETILPSQVTPERAQHLVQTGQASKVLPVGTQLVIPWTYGGKTYQVKWDVVHHYDGSDDSHPLRDMADGTKKAAMCIMMHNCFPVSTPFSSREAFYVAQDTLAAGAYHLTVKVTVTWGPGIAAAVGSTTYQFTTTKSHPKGSQLVWNASHDAKPTSLDVYETFAGSSAENCAIAAGSTGTDLGTMTEVGSSAGLNNIQRSCEGSDRWDVSAARMLLNSNDSTWTDTKRSDFQRPSVLSGSAGLLTGFDKDFLSVLAKVSNRTELHDFDGGGTVTTSDYLYPVSAREHGFENYLGATSDGFKAEGVPLDYWTKLKASMGRSAYTGWVTYPELITYGMDNGAASGVFERSARLGTANASGVGGVTQDGIITDLGAVYGFRLAPAACIA